MLYAIKPAPEGGYLITLNDHPLYRVCRQPPGQRQHVSEAWVLQLAQGSMSALDQDMSVDLLIDRTAQSLRRAGNLAKIAGGVLVWVRTEAADGLPQLYVSGAGYLCTREPNRVVSEHPVHQLGLDVLRARIATLSERMDAGESSFGDRYQVVFIPRALNTEQAG